MASSPPDFVYFDMGNVLLSFDHELAVQAVARRTSLDPALIRHVIFGSGLELQYERGELTTDEFHAEFCQWTNAAIDRDELAFLCSDIFQPLVQVHALVEHLHRDGRRLGVLSNTCAAHWQYVYPDRHAALWDRFEAFALSFELKSLKPEPQIYQLAARLVGVAPDRILFIDDRPENVDAARGQGFDAVLFTSAAQLSVDLRVRGLISSENP